jgi:hypothetical protein
MLMHLKRKNLRRPWNEEDSLQNESRLPERIGMQHADKVCYLDFDGVLHDEEVFWHPRRGIYLKTPGRTLFEWLPILDELFAPHPDVKIVLSTSWVRARSFYFAKKQLTPRLQERVIGATYHRRHMRQEEFIRLP